MHPATAVTLGPDVCHYCNYSTELLTVLAKCTISVTLLCPNSGVLSVLSIHSQLRSAVMVDDDLAKVNFWRSTGGKPIIFS